MVKNISGGKRAKAVGRKFETAAPSRLRAAEDPAEMYAIVTKLWGNGLLQVTCADGESRKCVIRQKFKGRRQRDNHVSLGSALLVGLREFETHQNTVDLLEVYTSADVKRLRSLDPAWRLLLGDQDPMEDDAIDIVADTTDAAEEIDFDEI